MLARSVGRIADEASVSGNRRGVDDRTALPRQHQRLSPPACKPHSFHIDLINAIKVLLSARWGIGPIAVDSGIVAGAVEATVKLLDLPKCRFDILRLGNVSTDENRLAAGLLNLPDGLIAGFLLDISENDDGGLFGEGMAFAVCLEEFVRFLNGMDVPIRTLGEKIEIVFDRMPPYEGRFIALHQLIKRRDDRSDLLGELTFHSRSELAQVQAADLIAYEFRKELDRIYYENRRPQRKSIEALCSRQNLVTGYMDADRLAQYAKRFEINA